MIDNVNELLVQTFLSGHATSAEKQALREWLALSEENRAYFREQWTVWHLSGVAVQSDQPVFDTDHAWLERHQGMEVSEGRGWHIMWHKVAWRIAAVLLFLIVPASAFLLGRKVGVPDSSVHSIETYSGTHSKIVLSDNTVVWLNSNSRLECKPNFGKNNRTVHIYGEGYFEVARNEHLPFIVETSQVSLRVLGTKFNIRDYDYDDFERVDLTQGEVSLYNASYEQEMTLRPNERMIYDKKTGIMRKERFNVTEANLWVSEQIFFNEKPLSMIASDLNRIFDVKITVAPAVANKKFYGLYNMENTTVDEILNSIAATGQVRLAKRGNEYKLY
ncbi:MAG: FecR domain-containing protein [Alloprevotella sp.]|nr:FecR domain-containing protein [Alloprevotella sp.]